MAKVVDADVPKSLIIEFKTPSGEVWATLTAEGRDFKTGSTGFYANGKIKNPKMDCLSSRLQHYPGRQQRVI
jgi:hypothetical protein